MHFSLLFAFLSLWLAHTIQKSRLAGVGLLTSGTSKGREAKNQHGRREKKKHKEEAESERERKEEGRRGRREAQRERER